MLKTPPRSTVNGVSTGGVAISKYNKLDKKPNYGLTRIQTLKRSWKQDSNGTLHVLVLLLVIVGLYAILFHRQFTLLVDRGGEGRRQLITHTDGWESRTVTERPSGVAAGSAVEAVSAATAQPRPRPASGTSEGLDAAPPRAQPQEVRPQSGGDSLRAARARARAANQAARAATGKGARKSVWGSALVLQNVAGEGGALAAQMSGFQEDLTKEAAAAAAGPARPHIQTVAQAEKGKASGSSLVTSLLRSSSSGTKTPPSSPRKRAIGKGTAWDDIFNKLEGFVVEDDVDAQDLKQAKKEVLDFVEPLDLDSAEEDWLVWPTSAADWAKRGEAVRQAAIHSWKAYESSAFGRDELLALSRKASDSAGGLGSSLVEALPTLWMLGLQSEFKRAQSWVEKEMVVDAKVSVGRAHAACGIVGGLLAAYDLSGDETLLTRARQLGERILPHQSQGAGFPPDQVVLSTGQSHAGSSCSLEGLGCLQLEMAALGARTGRASFTNVPQDLSRRLSQSFPDMVVLPQKFECSGANVSDIGVTSAAGGTADYYDSLLKLWILLGKPKSGLGAEFRTQWVRAIAQLISKLQRISGLYNFLYTGQIRGGNFTAVMEAQACRFPASIAAGIIAGAVDPEDINVFQTTAYNMSYTCYQMFNRMPSGLGPQAVAFHPQKDMGTLKSLSANALGHEAVEAVFYMWRLTGEAKWREYGWRMFNSFNKHSRVSSGGYVGVQDVTKVPPLQADRQWSIWMGGTLRFFHLLFSPPEALSLDSWIINMRGHQHQIGATKPPNLGKDVTGVERS